MDLTTFALIFLITGYRMGFKLVWTLCEEFFGEINK